MSTTILLEHLRDVAGEREASDRRFRRVLELGDAMGVPAIELASAARLSTSRVHAILAGAGKPFRGLADSEIEYVLERANTVAIVPANQMAYEDYERYSAYICQAHRSFRRETKRIGFYANREIKREFPKILRTWDDVALSEQTVAALHTSGDADEVRLADIIGHVLANPTGGRRAGSRHKVLLLSARGHADTLTIDQPIRHNRRGRGQAWVRRQRYTSEAAILRQPKTTEMLHG